jgi:hypothetical protein
MLRRFFLKLTLNIFPPLFFNRIYLKNISADYREMNVFLKRSFTNINYYKSIFGGSIFSACDPFFPIMYYHIFKEKKLIVWTKSAEIQYLSPAKSSLKLNFKITDDNIKEIELGLKKYGKCEIINGVVAVDNKNNACAEAKINVYLRDPNFINHNSSIS